MSRIYKKHGSSFKCKVALNALKGSKAVAELCQEYSVAAYIDQPTMISLPHKKFYIFYKPQAQNCSPLKFLLRPPNYLATAIALFPYKSFFLPFGTKIT